MTNLKMFVPLGVAYQLFERIIYITIQFEIDRNIRVFRQGCDQVTSHIKSGFQSIKKTSLVLCDISSAYDTVWPFIKTKKYKLT